MVRLSRPGLRYAPWGAFLLLLSCGGGDGGDGSPMPPVDTGQTVLVQVTTTGDDIDADGYTVRLGTRSSTVNPTGTATFDDVPAGTYQVSLDGVAANCTIQGDPTRSVSVTASSGAQTSFSVECEFDFGDGLPTVACISLSLAATSGVPLDRIAAGSMPGALDPPIVARVLTTDAVSIGYAWFEVNDEAELEFVTPLHPSGELEGGEVLIRATDGTVACEPFAFTIEPLLASPGEVSAVVAQLQDVLRAQAAILETTPEELMTTPLEQVPEVLLPMAIIQWVLDHPDNDESLRRVADGTAPSAVPLDLAEALLARVGLREELEGRSPTLGGAPPGPLASVGAEDCTVEAVGSATQRLSDCMNAAYDVLGELEGSAEEVGPRLAAAITLMAAVPAADQALQGVLAGLSWTLIQEELYSYATLPCCFSGGMLPDVDPDRFAEDDERTGTWSFEVGARSKGWDAALAALENLFALEALSGLDKVGVRTWEVTTGVHDLLEGAVMEHLPDLQIPSQEFGPVPVDDEEWSDVAYKPDLGAPPSIEEVMHTSYRPIAVGRTRVSVTIPPDEDGRKFGGTRLTADTEIHVDSIILHLEPQDTVLEPDDEATFRVTVENSRFPDFLSAGSKQGQFVPPVEQTGENTFNLLFRAPSSPNFDDPDILDVLHDAETGARANGPERRKEATVHYAKVEISPNDVFCQPLSSEMDFTVEVGPEDAGVTWSVDEGTIDQEGHYVAPPDRPASGMATVRATHNTYPEIFDEVTFAIGCTCTFRLSVEGVTIVAEPGDRLSFLSEDGRLVSLHAVRDSETWEAFLLPPDEDVASRPDGPGFWPMHVQGDMGLSEPDVLWASGEEEDEKALLNLKTLQPPSVSGARVEGTIDGATVRIISTEDPRDVFFDWSFAIEFTPPQFQCVVPGG